MRPGWWFITGLVFAASPLYSAELPIAGHIVAENNLAVAGAVISFRPQGPVFSKEEFQTQSDATGGFTVSLPAPGEYLVNAEHEGYFQLKDQRVRIADGGELHLVLNHVREVFNSVDVNASPSSVDLERTDSQQRLSGIQILNVPYPVTRDLRNALKLMPGVVQGPNGEMHFDGSSENQVLYTLDGFNISDPLTGSFNTRLSVDSVRSVKYSSGRFSPEFGKGSAGALAIQTDPGDDQLRYSGTNFVPGIDTKKGPHIGTWSPRFGLSGPIRKGKAWFSDTIDGEYSQLVVEDLPQGHDRTGSFRAGNLLHAQVNLTPASILFAEFLVNYWNAPGTGLGALDPHSTTLNRRSRTWFFSLKNQIYLAPGTLLEYGFAQDRTFARQIPQGHDSYIFTPYGRRGNFFIDSTQTSRRDQFMANLFLPSFHLAGAHQLKTGIDLDRLNYWQDIRRTGYELYGISGNLLSKTTFGGSGVAGRASAEVSSYVVDAWKVRSNLLVEIGARQDWDELVRRIVLSPRASFSYAPFGSKDTKIAGGYAVVYDATNLEIFARPLDQYSITTNYGPAGTVLNGPLPTFFSIQNHHLKAPRSQNWSAGLERRLPRKFDLSVSLLRRRTSDGFAYVVAPGAHNVPGAVFALTNLRRDVYDSAAVTVHHALREEYEWMASYTRSRALSNSVLDLSVDQTLQVTNNVGRFGWDSPNRFLSWGFLPVPRKDWALAYLFETRDGFPYSVQRDNGQIVGAINSYRYPEYFDLNLHLERRLRFRKYKFALRGGFNNITNHRNPTVVNNVLGSPKFLSYYGSEGRHFVFRLRWLGKADEKGT